MTNIKSLGLKIIATAILGLGLIGCGSDDSPVGETTQTDSTINTGIFVDSPVEGLKYSTSTLSGFTDNQGRFQYKNGETVTFKIGNLELGSAKGDNIVSPLTLTGESDLDNISNKATNIGRILQSLDEESSNTGLIKISTSLKDLDVLNIDLESDADLGTILQKAQDITSESYLLKDSVTAKIDMKKYIGLYNKYPIIGAGTYIESYGTNKYFLFTMPEDGNVIVDTNTYTTATVYDLDLNPIKSNDNNSTDFGGHYLAGTYVIKIYFAGWNSSDGKITINSSILFNQNNLSKIEAGTYTESYGTDKYFLFTMPEDGNVIVDTNTYTTATVYDLDLNPVKSNDNNSINFGGNYLAGTYVIKIHFAGWNGSDGKITINSSVLD